MLPIGLIKDIRTADKQIKDLKGTVDMADRNREKFQHISNSELAQRKGFVDEMTKELAGMCHKIGTIIQHII
jgi:hypothetical protein